MGRNAGQLQSLDRRLEKRTVWTLEFENNRDLHYFAMFTLSEEERAGYMFVLCRGGESGHVKMTSVISVAGPGAPDEWRGNVSPFSAALKVLRVLHYSH